MSNFFEFPVVGLFHRPPAMALGKILPLNANLWLRAEPTNPYDSNAIAVDLDIDLLNLASRAELRREIKAAFDHYREHHPDVGKHLEDVERAGTFHLGFIAATDALKIKTDFPDFTRTSGILRFGLKGKPFVRFSIT